MPIQITHIDTACCLIEIDGFKILTDPVLDVAGGYYHHGWGTISKKTSSPIIEKKELEGVELVLLSHPQHKDNFDKNGKAFSKQVPLILSTPKIEKKWSNGKGLRPWESHHIQLPNGKKLTITATPAQHHPGWLPKFFSGHVIGFVLELSGTKECVYITGDTVYFKGIETVAKRFPRISLAIIHLGGVQFRYLTGTGQYTMDASGFVRTIQSVLPALAIPIHNDGWTHFKENDTHLKQVLKNKPELTNNVLFLKRGVKTKIEGIF